MVAALLMGCESPAPEGQDTESFLDGSPTTNPVTPAPTTPSPAPFTGRSVLSSWVLVDQRHCTIDLSSFPVTRNGDSFSGATANGFYQHIVCGSAGQIICYSEISISGNEQSGAFNVTRSRNPSESANDAYCDNLVGNYQYSRIDSTRLEFCRASPSGCFHWFAP